MRQCSLVLVVVVFCRGHRVCIAIRGFALMPYATFWLYPISPSANFISISILLVVFLLKYQYGKQISTRTLPENLYREKFQSSRFSSSTHAAILFWTSIAIYSLARSRMESAADLVVASSTYGLITLFQAIFVTNITLC